MEKDGFLDKAYGLKGADATRSHYDGWSGSYDQEVNSHGYATPARIADAVAKLTPDKTAPVLDFGCGTGISGAALKNAGFGVIDGYDLSADMLAQARSKGIYRTLAQVDANATLPIKTGEYPTIVACGVIGSGAAPVEVFDMLMTILSPHGRFAFSFNDHTLQDPIYEARLNSHLDTGMARLLFREHGAHLPGINLRSVVYVVEKT